MDIADPVSRDEIADRAADSRAEPRWPALMAFLTAWWLPATTARRMQHVSLVRAFGVHLLAAVLGLGLFCVLVAWEEHRPDSGRSFAKQVGHIFTDAAQDCRRQLSLWPVETVLATSGVILLVEAEFLSLALLLGPWGAADERARASIANALRHVWLHTVDFLPGALLVGCVAVPLFHAERNWHRRRAEEGNSVVWNQIPLHIRYNEEIIGLTSTAAGFWVLGVMMRAVGARRQVPPIERPPTCETCGYNLTTMPLEARCPECGESVVASLGPEVRPGAPWEHRRRIGRLRAWWSTSVDVFLRPTRLGRQVRVSSRVVDHRLFMVGHVLAVFFIGFATLIGVYYAIERRSPLEHDPEVFFIVAPILGTVAATSILAGSLLFAGLFGLWIGWAYKRNLIPAAMQVAGYLSAFLTACCLVSGLLGITMVVAGRDGWFEQLAARLQIHYMQIAFLVWLVPSIAMGLLYLVLLYRGVQPARYANR